MNRQGPRRAAFALLVAAMLLGGGCAAVVASGPARAAATAVHVNASDYLNLTAEPNYLFTPSTFEMVPARANIIVVFTDNDVSPHTFTILGVQGVNLPADTSTTRIDQLAYGNSPSPLFNKNASPTTQVTGNFTSPGVGWYEFICTESGHFQNGMYGYIAFGMNLPGNLTVVAPDTDPGAAVFIIVGTIVALVVIALVLGFVVGRRRGSAYEMPPQRLGYAEPTPPESTPDAPLSHDPRG